MQSGQGAPRAPPALPKAPFLDGAVKWTAATSGEAAAAGGSATTAATTPSLQLRADSPIKAGQVIARELPSACFDFVRKVTGGTDFTSVASSHAAQLARAPASGPTPDGAAATPMQRRLAVYGGEDGSDAMVGVLFPSFPMLGHSDCPNCTLHVPWALRINERVIVSLVALTDINPGTPLTICHVSRLQDPEARAARLVWQYGEGAVPDGAGLGQGLRAKLTAVKQAGGSGDAGEGSGSTAAGAAAAAAAAPSSLPAPLQALHSSVPSSSTINPGTAGAGLTSALAFLAAAAPVLQDTHWACIRARRTAIVSLMYQRKWAEAWAQLRTQGRAVFALLHPADAEAQYHTHSLAEHILRGWQTEDKASAGQASLGAMLRYSQAATALGKAKGGSSSAAGSPGGSAGGSGGDATPAGAGQVAAQPSVEAGPASSASAADATAAPGALPSNAPVALLESLVSEHQWLRDMMWGAQVLRQAQQEGFVEGPMPGH